MTCYFCGELGHAICPFIKDFYIIEDYNSDKVELSEFKDGELSDNNFYSILNKYKSKDEKIEQQFTQKKTLHLLEILDTQRTSIFLLLQPKMTGF